VVNLVLGHVQGALVVDEVVGELPDLSIHCLYAKFVRLKWPEACAAHLLPAPAAP
jgi:hypothetical protein